MAEQRRIAILKTTMASFEVLFRNSRLALKLAILPFLVYSIFWSSQELLFWSFQELFFGNTPLEALPNEPRYLYAYAGLLVLASIVTIPMITAWHRLIIISDAEPTRRLSFSVRKAEFLYLKNVVIFFIVIALLPFGGGVAVQIFSALAIGFMNEKGPGLLEHLMVATIVFLFVGVTIGTILRYSLIFPAVAVGANLGFHQSWKRSTGNTWRLFFIVMAISISFAIIEFGILFISFAILGLWEKVPAIIPVSSSPLTIICAQFLKSAILICGVYVNVSFLSWSYVYLVMDRDIGLGLAGRTDINGEPPTSREIDEIR